MYADAKSRNVAAFVGCANRDDANVGGKERLEESHPRDDDGEAAIVVEEDVRIWASCDAVGI